MVPPDGTESGDEAPQQEQSSSDRQHHNPGPLARWVAALHNTCHRYPMAALALAWIAGTWLSSQPIPQPHLSPTTIAIAAASLIAVGLACRRFAWLSGLSIWFSLLLLALGLALYRAPAGGDSLSGLAERRSQSVALRGVIQSAATWSPSQFAHGPDPSAEAESWLTQWTVDWSAIRDGTRWLPIECRSKLMVPGRIHQFLPGDEIEVFGGLRSIEVAPNPGMPDFAEISRRQNLFVSVKADDVSQIKVVGFSAKHWPQRLRGIAVRWVDSVFHQRVAFEQAPLAAALVFGQREQVDWELQQQLMVTGTIHMLAISGMHVEMIAGALLIACVLLSVRPRWMLFLIVGVSLLYAALAGGRPPVMRAVVLVLGTSVARYWGFHSSLFNLLGLAAFLLLMLDPDHLYNPGVHLSFLAVSTIGIFRPRPLDRSRRRSALQSLWEESFSRGRQWALNARRNLWDMTSISLWVWLMTCPLIWVHFNLISPIAVPMNVLLGLPLMVGLLAGLLTAVFGWIPPLAWLFGNLSGGCLWVICWLVEQASRIPMGHFWLPSPAAWWVGVFYAWVAFWFLAFRKCSRAPLAIVLLCWIAVGIGLYVPGPKGLSGGRLPHWDAQPSSLQCTFLDVGHGTCVLIELPDGRLWVYDAGRLGDNQRSFRWIAPSIWASSAAHIDRLIISHADADHYNAVLGLLQRFSIAQVASTHGFWNSSATGAVAVRRALEARGIPLETWSTETRLPSAGSLHGQVLHPPATFSGESDNAHSLCLRLEYAGVGILLSGDIEGSGLSTLCESPSQPCQIMMAPHHGSLSHDTSELRQWCRPEVIVISGGERAARPAVIQEYSTSSTLGITFRDRAIRISVHPDGSYDTLHWMGDGWSQLQPDSCGATSPPESPAGDR